MLHLIKILLPVLFFCSASSWSQDGEQGVLEKLSEKLAAHKVVQGEFRQTKTIAKLSRTFVSDGNFIISKDSGIVWNVQKPFASTMVVPIEKIQSFFSGDPQELKSRFDVHYFRKGSTEILNLVPKEKTFLSVVASIELRFGENLEACLIHDANGDTVLYEFFNHQYHALSTP